MSSFKEILRATFITGKLTVVRIITSFGRSKLNAVIIGAAGLGLYSQANYLSLFLASICSLGLVNGMMQRISYSRERQLISYQREVQATVLTTQLALLLLMLVLSFFFIAFINKEVFASSDHKLDLSIFLVISSVVFVVIASNYMEGFFFSYGRYDLYTKASIAATVVGFLLFVPLIYFFGVYGAFAALFLNSACLFLSYLFYIRKIESLSNVFVIGFKKKIFFEIFPEGLINLFYGVLVSCSALVIRNIMIRHEGPAANGLYQICTSITALYVPFLTNPLWAKLFPSVSAKGKSAESDHALYNILFFTVVSSTLCVLALFIKPDWIIFTLASKDFVPSVKFFPFYFPGDVFFNILFAYSVFLLALRRIKEYTLLWAFYFGIQYIGSVVFIKNYGSTGIAIAYTFAGFTMLIFALSRFIKIINTKFSEFLLLLLACVSFIIAEGVLLHYDYSFLLRIALLAAWGSLLLLWHKDIYKKYLPFDKLFQRSGRRI